MAKYTAILNMVLTAEIEVEADSEEAAEAIVWGMDDEITEYDFSNDDGWSILEIREGWKGE